MPPIRAMHFADTHFGVETYGRLDPATGMNSRLIDFRDTLNRAIDMALERGIDVALFAGDAYKGRDPSQTHQREFALCIRRITERGVPVVMLAGNHDMPNVRGRAHAMEIYRTLGVQGVHILSRPEVVRIETARGPLQVAAMPYLMRGFLLARDELQGKTLEEIREFIEGRYSETLAMLAGQMDPSVPAVLLGHFWVRNARLSSWQSACFHVSEPQVELSALERPEWDYVALGHIHCRQRLNPGGSPPVVYCGSPDCIDFGERNERKGFAHAEISRGEAAVEFVDVPPSRPLVDIEVDAECGEPTEAILAAISAGNICGAIVRLVYRIGADQRPLVREKEIREALAPAFMVAAMRADVRRDQAARSRAVTESLDPLAALSHYLETSDRLRKRKEALLPYAERLYEELLREEAVR